MAQGWGVKKITFVDNSKVSFSNPPRQSLYNYQGSNNKNNNNINNNNNSNNSNNDYNSAYIRLIKKQNFESNNINNEN